MRRISRIFLSFLALTLILISGLLILLAADPGRIKGGIEYLVTQQTGREFVIDGNLDLELGRHLRVTAEGLRLANTDWGKAGSLLSVGKAEIVVDLFTLVSGSPILELLEIDSARLALESAADGTNNWTFIGKPSAPEDEAAATGFGFILRLGRIESFELTYDAPEQAAPLRIMVAKLEQRQLDDGKLGVSLEGTINEIPVRLTGQYGPFDSLLTGRNLVYDLAGQLDTLEVVSAGYLTDLQHPDLDLSVKGPDLERVTELFGIPGLGTGTLDLNAALRQVDQGVEFTVGGNIGQFLLDATGEASDLVRLDRIIADVDFSGPSLGAAAALFGLDDLPGDPFDVTGKLSRSGEILQIERALIHVGAAEVSLNGTLNDFPRLGGADLALRASGPDLERFRKVFGLPGEAAGAFRINGDLGISPDGSASVDVTILTDIAELEVSGTLTDPPEFVGTHLRYSGQGPDFQKFGATYNYPGLIAEPFTIEGEIGVVSGGLITDESLRVNVSDNELVMDGAIRFDPLETGTDVRIGARGSNLAEILGMAGIEDGIPPEPYDISGQLEIIDAGYRFTEVRGTVGESRLTAEGIVARTDDFSGSEIELTASGPDPAPLLIGWEGYSPPRGPFAVSGKFRLGANEVQLERVKLNTGGAELALDAIVALPIDLSELERSNGEFDLRFAAPDFSAVLPPMEDYQPDASSFALQANGNWRDGLWAFGGVRIVLDDAEIKFSGEIDQPPDWSATDLQLSADIPDLSKLGLINGQRLPATNVSFTVLFSGAGDRFSMDEMVARIGDGDLRGRLALMTGAEIPEVDIDLASNRLDLRPFLVQQDGPVKAKLRRSEKRAQKQQEKAQDPGAPNSATPPADGRLIPDLPLPLEALNRFNADVVIDADEVRLDRIAWKDFSFHAVLRDGALNIDRVAGTGPAGNIAATLTVIPDSSGATATMTLDGQNLYVGLMIGREDRDVARAPRYDADIDLVGRGSNLREIASTLNGRVKLTSDGGFVENTGMQLMFGSFFEELIASLNPFIEKDQQTELVCAAYFADATDGVFEADSGLVIQTDKMNIIAKGKVDLTTEKLNVNFSTGARKGVGISAGDFVNPYIKVGGTLAKPKIALDAPTAAVTTGAAVATMGVSLLATAAARRIFRRKDPCGWALRQLEKKESRESAP